MTIRSHVSPISTQNEVDLFHVLRLLWRRKALIIFIALATALLGGVYAYVVPPQYEVSTILRPVALNDLDSLNRSKVYSLPPEMALKRVGASLDSHDTRLSYFRSKPELVEAYALLGETPEQAFSNFNDALTLMQPDPKKADILTAFIGLKMRFEGELDGASILNDFVRYTIDRERKQIAEDLKVIVDNRLSEIDAKLESAVADYDAKKESKIARLIENDTIKRAELQDELKALRVQLKMRRDARLAQLDEAISIARSLGLKKPATPSSMAEDVVGAGSIIRTEVNSQQVPLYFMGSDVLEAERNILRKRTSDDFTEPRIAQIRKALLMLTTNRKAEVLLARQNEVVFLDGIDALRTERTRLKHINTDLQNLGLVSIDQYAISPVHPVKPRKILIIVTTFIIGLMLGVFVALARGLFKARLRQVRNLELERDVGRVSTQMPVLG